MVSYCGQCKISLGLKVVCVLVPKTFVSCLATWQQTYSDAKIGGSPFNLSLDRSI